MSKKILIVESDTALSAALRQALEARGFSVDETSDGKGSVEQVRRDRPELVVLAVELSAGQNGYLICGKLKKDEELKAVPIIITGNPDGFAQHRKLKAHADDYVARPVDVALLVERVGALIGFPELAGGDLVEDGLDLPGLDGPLADTLDDEPVSADFGGEEISVDGEEAPAGGDTELDMLDAAFDDISTTVDTTELESHLDGGGAGSAFEVDGAEEPVVAPPERAADSRHARRGGDDVGALDVLEQQPSAAPPPVAERPKPAMRTASASAPASAMTSAAAPRAAGPSTGGAAEAAELRSLRARVAELQGALEDAQGQAMSAEERARALETDLEARTAELEAARASSVRTDKDTFALREVANRKDKELLRLKAELNEREQELVELRDRQLQLEQQGTETSAEVAKRDAQLKALTSKAELLTAERRRVDQQLLAAREEARSATAKLAALQAELDGFQAHSESSQAELRAELEAARAEAADAREQLADAQAQLAEVRGENSALAASAAEESDGLRQRIAELEESHVRYEDRVARLYARIKADEGMRERARKALGIAQQLLEERPASADADEEAAA